MNREILEACAIRRRDVFDRLEFHHGDVWLTLDELSKRFPNHAPETLRRELETLKDDELLHVRKCEGLGLQFNTSPLGVVYLNEQLLRERRGA